MNSYNSLLDLVFSNFSSITISQTLDTAVTADIYHPPLFINQSSYFTPHTAPQNHFIILTKQITNRSLISLIISIGNLSFYHTPLVIPCLFPLTLFTIQFYLSFIKPLFDPPPFLHGILLSSKN